ncbi:MULTISPECIES: peptidoglycan D,D-transpeptidase FtsI family protein [Halomonadaceae]|jgi:cell division protein FtsI (penicillin-binding protein 3)|uniref:Peptidoglycan D,D-transpeptidase FtsI n=1 Tax=Vreelandella titanicae TaxID=664683 RepID=A0A653PZQ6_9GAMM|nr:MULTISPECIES: penicillin-binding transpeptidase domain-containing protein [Halomonas]UEQ05950.1 penicillin-binding protein 2 [Halomonas profundus]QKS23041.1 Peptidoglycan D,D-transpeptidase FtsI [Halomonas titanicae]QNU61850.1 penicillin-binding protein 2 [Halomonas titanicae]TMU25157.1 penicillin-binding protein 2 [Halomonas sp. ATBC28]CAD5262818.1 transpeptidase involved in septal peptidoglycan synthesis (penicillin-binding protein 3) [Halomonas sp. 156]
MRSERRGGTSRQAPIAPPLGSGRFMFILLAIGLASAILIGRITLLQVIDRPFLQSQGDARTLRHETIPAHRGMITDRNGEPLAISTPVVTLWANPQELPDDAIQRVMLAQALGMTLGDFEARVARFSEHEFMYLRRQMTPAAAQQILNLRTPGVYPQREYKRYYPAGEVAAQLLGVTNVDDVGQEGLELAYQPYLAGRPGQRRVIKDRRGRLVRELGVIDEAQPGGELTLSIDQRIQYMAYRELRAAVAENEADGGVLVMMDARTGEVLAMANLPSYNPNNRAGLDPRGLRNQALVDVFEPGSVMKPLAMAAVLESGVVDRDAVVDTSPGWMRLDQFTIRDFRNYGELDLAGILEHSSNVGMSRLALRLSDTAIWEKYNQLGLGQAPGTGFPGESTGSLPAPVRWSRSERATLSYGYGLSVSAVQLASAYTALANDGVRLPPSLLRLSEPPQGIPAIEPTVANDLLRILETSVAAYTGGRRARVEGYRVGGKTGTVRKIGQQGYTTDAYRSVFAGIAPISDPRIVTVVMIDHPKAGEFYGGAVAAPVFSSVTGNALRLLDVPPDHEAE